MKNVPGKFLNMAEQPQLVTDPVCGMHIAPSTAAGHWDYSRTRYFFCNPDRQRQEGQTVMFLAADGKPAGTIGAADPIKASTEEAIRLLHADGLRLMMVTGDNRTTPQR